MDRAVAAARAALPAGAGCRRPRRGEILFRAAELLIRNKRRLGELVTREMGKVIAEGLGDVQEAIDIAFYMAGEGRRLQGETVPSELPDKDCKSVREPLGVVALVTPWNFPIAIPAWKLFAALICGNTRHPQAVLGDPGLRRGTGGNPGGGGDPARRGESRLRPG